ncbi:hypothetical protein CANARDRAFT_23292 [[Candida] arabinofermentans NRRL YB-2248]|uniref:Uncharacterized protein n=1 Tax=[Candida] arabinofermentans NRRL YB-2248 TaxID=983967 RepID=A0A1E4T0G5_9ASCO|nr:hypothetical protein CANARDRAFT_23292 [[Candida] arabinofermentans NRRL YB-2248]
MKNKLDDNLQSNIYENQIVMLDQRDLFEILCNQKIMDLDEKIDELKSEVAQAHFFLELVEYSVVLFITYRLTKKFWKSNNNSSGFVKLIASHNILTLFKRVSTITSDVWKSFVSDEKANQIIQDEDDLYSQSIIDQYYSTDADDVLNFNQHIDEVTGEYRNHYTVENPSGIIEVASSTQDGGTGNDELFEKSFSPQESPNSEYDLKSDIRSFSETSSLLPIEAVRNRAYVFDPKAVSFDTSNYTKRYLLSCPVSIDEYRRQCYSDYSLDNESIVSVDTVTTGALEIGDIITDLFEESRNEKQKDPKVQDRDTCERIKTLRFCLSMHQPKNEQVYRTVIENCERFIVLVTQSALPETVIELSGLFKDLVVYEFDGKLNKSTYIRLVKAVFRVTHWAKTNSEYKAGISSLFAMLTAIAIDEFVDCFDELFCFHEETNNKDIINETSLDSIKLELLKMVICDHYETLKVNSSGFFKLSTKMKPHLVSIQNYKNPKVQELKDVWEMVSRLHNDENHLEEIVSDGVAASYNSNSGKELSSSLSIVKNQTNKKGLRNTNRSDITNF